MKILIACSSCWRDIQNGSNHWIRETWGQLVPKEMDLRFFIGGRDFNSEELDLIADPTFVKSPPSLGKSSNLKPITIGNRSALKNDEVLLVDTPDGYLGLPWKTKNSLQWALDRGYDYIFRIFVDTYVFPNRLLKSGFENYDAMGWTFPCGPCAAHPNSSHLCPHGGCGYWTNRKAAQAIIDEPTKHWGEDTHAGFALHNAGIEMVKDGRYCERPGIETRRNLSTITLHMNDRSQVWEPTTMFALHQAIGREVGFDKC